jgi:hypothetical protein
VHHVDGIMPAAAAHEDAGGATGFAPLQQAAGGRYEVAARRTPFTASKSFQCFDCHQQLYTAALYQNVWSTKRFNLQCSALACIGPVKCFPPLM